MRLPLLFLATFVIAPPSVAQSFDYPDFSNMAGLALNQDAAQFGGNTLRLTPSAASATGTCYYTTPVTVTDGFTTVFDFKVDAQTCSGADGIAFIIHNDSRTTTFVGVNGGQIGYGGLVGSGNGAYNALVIELDSYLNGADLSPNEVSVHTNGTADLDSDEAFSIGSSSSFVNMWDEQVHTCEINYTPGTLTVYVDDYLVVSTTYDFATGGTFIGGGAVGGPSLISGTDAYVGFTAACGGCTENHDILSWSWGPYEPPPPPPVPIWEEDFDGGTFPPVGWTVIDNVGNGNVWNVTSTWTKGNTTTGSGEAAGIDDDEIGDGNRTHTELITPLFDVTGPGQLFLYTHNFNDQYVSEVGTVDISVAGGPWTNLATYNDAAFGPVVLDLDSYAGTDDVQIRFNYDDMQSWGWYWHVDDVGLYQAAGSGPGTPYCFGNASGGNFCPCGNDNDGSDSLGAGCAHDDSVAGARLGGSGVASISGDSLILEGVRGPISNSSLFFQANNNLDGSANFLGDGLRCAGGGLIRLKVKLTDASGNADSSPAVITTRSASFGHTISAGETLYYQWWFRDSDGSPCSTESNTSNGYEVTWIP